MIEHDILLKKYSSEYYLIYSTLLTESNWGNKDIALKYLKKYYLPEDEYLEKWKPIQNLVFTNQDKSLPEMMFQQGFSLLAIRGGVLFDKEEFEKLQRCINQIGDKKLFIIQNDFGGTLNTVPFRMSFPSNISWDELMSGNFISTVIFEMFANEYFVFSESGKWGKYCANNYENPLDIIGFNNNYSHAFTKVFKQSHIEMQEVKQWLPSIYRNIVE